jgi:cell division protein FtsI/penicillin-binding protein 2
VVTSPLKMARVSASIANGGIVVPVRWTIAAPSLRLPASSLPLPASSRFLSSSHAAALAKAMRDVVTDGTGRSVKGNAIPIAGKTGTAEVADGAAHSWFTGFAPYGGSGRRIAFAVLVENAGYGARAAAPVASELVTAAREFELIK